MRAMATSFERQLAEALRAATPRPPTESTARRAAVLIPVVGAPEPTLVLTVRTETLSSHRGPLSVPGGAIDPGDDSPRAAAVREAREELGWDDSGVRILGELDAVETFVSGFVVFPVVAWLDALPALRPNPAEVARVLLVPVAELTEDVRSEPGFSHGGRVYPTEAWIHGDEVIWGVTARILRMFLGRLAEGGLAEAPGGSDAVWQRSGARP